MSTSIIMLIELLILFIPTFGLIYYYHYKKIKEKIKNNRCSICGKDGYRINFFGSHYEFRGNMCPDCKKEIKKE